MQPPFDAAALGSSVTGDGTSRWFPLSFVRRPTGHARGLWTGRIVVVAALAVLLVGVVRAAEEQSATRMATAAARFVESLSPELKARALFAFESDERRKWHFVPNEMFPRNGLPLADMSEPQRGLARELMRAGLSDRGLKMATEVMNSLEAVLRDTEQRGTFARDPQHYRFSVFGTPAQRGAWGWRVEGHHVSLHFTVVDGSFVAASPAFLGSNPAEVRSGPRQGLRVLAQQEDTARAFLASLDATQRATAVVSTAAPGDIETMNALEIRPLEPGGISASALSAAQKDLLRAVIDTYTGVMADDVAAARWARLRAAGLDTIRFAWMGEIERGKRHYYRVQGPTFLVEYDNTQNNANHIHSVWRDFDGDFGRDLLREHLRSAAH